MRERENNFYGDMPLLLRVEFFAFSKEIKKQVREEQGNICADCGMPTTRLEIHHRVPQCQGGTDRIENAVGLCGPRVNDCHEKWDKLALEEHLYASEALKPVTKAEMPQECFKSQNYNKMPKIRKHRKRRR